MNLLSQKSSPISSRYTSGEKLAEEVLEEFAVVEEARAAIKKAKLPVPRRPFDEDEAPKLPRDLATVTPQVLGRLMTEYTSLADYAAFAAAEASIELARSEHVYEYVQAHVRMQKTGTIQAKADKTMVDPAVKAAAQAYYKALALSKMTDVLLRGYERDLATVSREISRRGNEFTRNVR